MGQIWSLVNSLQMLMTNCLLNVPMPGNVFLLMTNLNTLSSGDLLPSDEILSNIFNFTPTQIANVGLAAMGVDSARLTKYMGSITIAMPFLLVMCGVYLIAHAYRDIFRVCYRLKNKIRRTQFWNGSLRFWTECYLDLAIGIGISFKNLRYETDSDYFDLVFTIGCTTVIVGLPIALAAILCRNPDLENDKFQEKYGSITEGYKTAGVHAGDTKKIIVWFLVRRLLTAAVVVLLADQTITF